MFVEGEEAIEYEGPDDFDEDNTCVRYIETKPGQKFGIRVTWLTGFRLKWADALYCSICKGGEPWSQPEAYLSRVVKHDRGTLTQPAILDFSSTTLKDPETGRRTLCEWEFEGVEMGTILLFTN